MIQRYLYDDLLKWKENDLRHPILLHGARQVGKTTLVNEFGKSYEQYLYFNLERPADRLFFEDVEYLDNCLDRIILEKGIKDPKAYQTLFFIDEVQESPKVIEQLRYFYEDYPYLHVIASGSLLSFGMEKVKHVPVGRIEYWNMYPVTFQEYLGSRNKNALEALNTIPFPQHLNKVIFDLFHEYTLIGGMPAVVNGYLNNSSISALQVIYAGINKGYFDDIEKYARNATERDVLRAIVAALPIEIDNRVKLNNFGNSGFRSREVKAAMRSLEKSGLIDLKYPTTQTKPPILANLKKKPRLHFLDMGLMNNLQGLQPDLMRLEDLHSASRGTIAKQVVAQELKAIDYLPKNKITFWVREEGNASSEVDIVYHYNQYLIPIEVKAGAKGRLRSLHEFMDRCDHTFAIRLYAGELKIDNMITRTGKTYHLLNLPYFLASQIDEYIDWFVGEVDSI